MGVTNRQARNIERRFQTMNRNLTSGFAGLGSSLTKAFAVAGGVRGLQSLLDSATRIDNALKVAGLSGDELEKVYSRLRDSAIRTAAPLETLVTLYGRAALVQKELGVSQEELLNFTDKIAVALRVAGTDAQSASGALLQLSQALGSGVVRAEEFNSILEGALPIAQAAAAGLKEAGGSVAALRQLVVDGKVSSEAFFRAFEAGSVILEQKVAGATLTTQQGFTNLRTALIDATRDFAKGSLSAEALGDAFGIMADKINGIDFKQFGEQARELIGMINQIREAMGWLQNMGANLGSMLGTDALGDWATGGAAFKEFAGGALTITNQRGLQRRIDDAFGNAVETAGGLTEQAIQEAYQRRGQTTAGGKTSRLPSTTVRPVSLDDYDPPSTGTKGGRSTKERADEYERLSRRIADSTAALVAETEVQRSLNPLVDDYGYAVEKARTEQELLSAAQKAGIAITPELRREISGLAEQYALASVEAAKLAEQQDLARENAEKWMGVGKDVTQGFIQDLINGKSAAESFAGALAKIGDALINDILNNLFKINSAGSGGILSSIFGLFGGGGGFTNFEHAWTAAVPGLYSSGGYTGPGPKNKPAGIVHAGEVVWSQDDIRKAGGVAAVEAMRLGGVKPAAIQAPVMPKLTSMVGGGGTVNAPVNINIDATGADREGLMRVEQQVAKLRQEVPSMVVANVRKAQKSNVKLG